MRALPLILLAVAGCSVPGHRPVLTVGAAADLQFALDEIARDFQAAEVRPTYGSSGNLFSQIQNHAPFDVFLSADINYPRRLAESGGAVANSIFTYGTGHIVVWVPKSSHLDPGHALGDPAVRHIAIANPQHAPYGRAAEAALHSMGIYDAVAGKLVFGENITQTLQFVQSGAADAGIVALSLALAPAVRKTGSYWTIPDNTHPAVEQGGIIVRDSPAARAFTAYIQSGVLDRYGFTREK